ncbi:MAG: FAD binding domain-containing protein [Bacillota bacterium]|nr:FAD binding domain-containing protein [Bacillota bacterium]
MIPFDLDYYAPEKADQAVEIFFSLKEEGRKPLYYAGGTEIISFCRSQRITPDALIDIKNIKDALPLDLDGDDLVYGAALSLSSVAEKGSSAIISEVVKCIADRTVRNRLTLGGNICGRLPYREAVLPFLLADAEILLQGKDGRHKKLLRDLFDKRLHLEEGDILLQLIVSKNKLNRFGWRKRREKHGPVDYPLYHICSLKNDGQVKIAVSGLCSFPFRNAELEKAINDSSIAVKDRVSDSIKKLPGPVRDDHLGSSVYREALWQSDLTEMIERMEVAE